MKPLVFDPRTAVEIQIALDFYSATSEIAGPQFLVALERTYEAIRRQPLLRGRIDRYHRAAPVRRYPFLVVYRIRRIQIDIVAIHHMKKGSFSWRSHRDDRR